MSENAARPDLTCFAPDCGAPAKLLPQLWVPAHALSTNRKFDGCASTMGFPVCLRCFHKLKPTDFLRDEGIRNAISSDFREFRAVPDWSGAKIYPLRPSEAAFKTWEDMYAKQKPH